ncbi:hypothetical protein ACW5YJ_12300 [Staphylococcus sp. mip270_02]
MVKIKRKVEMTCGEFAKYMVDNFGFSSYAVELSDGYWLGSPEREYDVSIHLPPSKISDLPDIKITKSGVVIFEVEEEITEDTVIPKVIELYSNENKNTFAMQHCDRTIKQIQDEGGCKSLAFYILNDDFTMTLIWTHDKGLVE